MKIYAYKTYLNESGNPYLVKGNGFQIDGRKKYVHPDLIVEFLRNGLHLHEVADEYSWIMCLDRAMHLIGCFEIGHSGNASCPFTKREIFQKALLIGASGIILAHNHPSGEVNPSKEDLDVTEEIKDAGDMVGIIVLDHIIIARETYLSFKEQNILFN